MFKEPLEHAESVSGEPFALFIIHFNVDVGENKFYRYRAVIERDAAANIIQRKYCNEKGLRELKIRPLKLVGQLHHYILKPIKHRGRVTPMCVGKGQLEVSHFLRVSVLLAKTGGRIRQVEAIHGVRNVVQLVERVDNKLAVRALLECCQKQGGR